MIGVTGYDPNVARNAFITVATPKTGGFIWVAMFSQTSLNSHFYQLGTIEVLFSAMASWQMSTLNSEDHKGES